VLKFQNKAAVLVQIASLLISQPHNQNQSIRLASATGQLKRLASAVGQLELTGRLHGRRLVE